MLKGNINEIVQHNRLCYLRPSHSEFYLDCNHSGHKNGKILANVKCVLGKESLSIVYTRWPFNLFLIPSTL